MLKQMYQNREILPQSTHHEHLIQARIVHFNKQCSKLSESIYQSDFTWILNCEFYIKLPFSIFF